ncbi:MAG: Lrp/AsnC ligand binding domain-containing protein [Candidatus Cryptobacteroides sp.]|nr:Lrp/AsnC ligand binding domain-containing protein [Bacteroidales bacterium]MDY2706467.1 Lrp/AsnC ligand binding domain-containing protein [Candidatus Cryptobacteroides sp.]MCI6313949.1 Lrp/AsnC ligand binding domain-containing protein [Bacteroidales bacterium]MCI7748897.1 Lrp/AsnC ligand binding domain-containing protein [Bacteroidales bacterium]MDD6114062.1 Lrp/AsnC ligand binding domain-containing protein [Bacteroidales bacterium]
MQSYHLDEIDRKILGFLIKNARMPFLEIARECGVSGAAIHQRVKKLELNGVITGSRLLVKPQALGLNVCAYISVTLSEANKYPEVIAAFRAIPEIVECHFVTGRYSLLVKLYCYDNDHLMDILLNTIQKIPYVQSTETQISLDNEIERQVGVQQRDKTEND